MFPVCPCWCCFGWKEWKTIWVSCFWTDLQNKGLSLGRRKDTYSTEIRKWEVRVGIDVFIFESQRQIPKGVDDAVALYLIGNSWLIRQSICALGLCFSALNVRDMICEKY